MMRRYLATTQKDIKLLLRDIAGLAMLFGMPILLIIIMTLLQDSTFKTIEEKKLPILILDLDKDTFGLNIVDGLNKSKFFDVHEQFENTDIKSLQERVMSGEFQIGIVINEHSSDQMRNNIRYNIVSILPPEDSLIFNETPYISTPAKVDLYFDPITKNSFKQSISSAINQFSSGVEAKMIFDIYSALFEDLLGMELRNANQFAEVIDIDTRNAGDNEEYIPNSVQHNVPAWTIFAMFFIVIPLAGNIIKERESGISKRLRIISGSNLPVLIGKVTTYFMIGIIQAITMIAVGILILPLFGLPELLISGNIISLLIMTAAVALAASGYGVLIGTISTSQEQSSIFGSISVVILAAIGGIWVPVFMMSEFMQMISQLSPLNWALNGYYDIFLRDAGFIEILRYVLYLLIFFLLCITVSWYYRNKRTIV
ncbi:MAG: ABC transporter permease [Lentimicrobiaceae bacterium]|jgi:ABC-2 type transport system permease protein|nr:ABC transporter permease [Lentimicrobiaceae bacterium]MBT3455373.1 ABC transporter permease [Lentimicrobiaceae bacterium]MBT3818787.1 ABC transporter permease [Lentimicrobiaceae bacterium]MBT4062054.1 ABC transporter permease [Lentimicrobiaceae bacterium]MBT4190814.1 ABC transporter permease [Lentimicrobiaceae bacterium]